MIHLVKTIAVLSLKGGVGKTTTAFYLAAVAASQGQAVTIIDADSEHSACRWAAHAVFPFEVIEGEPDRLARQVKAALNEGRTVIIDTPPNSRELLLRAGGLADIALVPVAPTGLEVDRLGPTLELLADLQAQRDELDVAVLLTRYNARRRLAREAEEALEGLPVLEARIREREVYKAVFGRVPTELEEWYCARGVPEVLIKRGVEGVLWAGSGAVQVLPAFPVEAVDTVAAGDALNGGLATAVLSVTRPGGQDSLPSRTEVKALMARAPALIRESDGRC